jgi:hypothetical protein
MSGQIYLEVGDFGHVGWRYCFGADSAMATCHPQNRLLTTTLLHCTVQGSRHSGSQQIPGGLPILAIALVLRYTLPRLPQGLEGSMHLVNARLRRLHDCRDPRLARPGAEDDVMELFEVVRLPLDRAVGQDR